MVSTKQHLTSASKELFRRAPDERFAVFDDLLTHCRTRRDKAKDLWLRPDELIVVEGVSTLSLQAGEIPNSPNFFMNDWSFGQLCRQACIDKSTVNRLSPHVASLVLAETMQSGRKPLQLFAEGETLRSLHGATYTRVFDADVVELVADFQDTFGPPQAGMNDATGMYCGEQDLFLFQIDPTGWVDIEGEYFAPGFFLWNSEVGKRSLGIQTFWFQAVCQNHIVWDAVDVIDFSRRHTSSVREGLDEIRRLIESLRRKKEVRQDAFVKCIRQAMQSKLGNDFAEANEALLKQGLSKGMIAQALGIAREQGRFTIFSIVDALTRISGELTYAGDRHEADLKAAQLLTLALAA